MQADILSLMGVTAQKHQGTCIDWWLIVILKDIQCICVI